MSEPVGSSGPMFWGDIDDTEALQRYRALVTAIDDGLYQLDAEDRFIAVNDEIVELTGYAREELLGEHVSLLLDNDDSTIEPSLTNLTDQSEQLECAVQTAEGDRVRCEVRVSLLESDGTVQGTVGIVQDITDSSRPDQPLEESDQRHNHESTNECEPRFRETKTQLEVAKAAGSVGTWSWDIQENTVTADECLAKSHDTAPEEVTAGVPIEEFFASVHEVDQERVWNQLDEAVEEAGEFEAEYRITDAEGDTLWVASRGEVEYDGNSEPCRIIGATADITERKEAGTELKRATAEEQNRLYETIISSTPDLIYAFDLDYRFTFANDAVLEMWGQTREEAIGKTLREIGYEPWHAEMHEREIDEVIETKEPIRGEVAFPHAERGRRVYEYIFAPVLNDDDEVETIAGTSRDVTERRQAEENLQKNKERFHALVTASSDVVYRMSPDWSEMHEFTGKELLADTDEPTSDWLDKYIHPDEQPRVTEAIDEAIQTKSTFELEHRVEQDDGSTGWTFSRAVPMLNEDGEIEEWIGMASDITERKRREQELERSEQRYRTLAEYFPNGLVTLFDHDLEYTLAAGQGFDQIPFEPDDLEGHNFYDVWPDETVDEFEPAILAALEGEQQSVEFTYGGREWVLHAVPITDERGDVFAGMTMAQDITEQKEREQYLQDAKSQLEAATEAGAVGTWEWDVQNDEMCVSPSFARTFGVDPDAAQQGVSLDRFIDGIHEDDRERVVAAIEDAVETCDEYKSEYRVWNADGELRWVVARGHVECDDGEPITFPGALTDITERKRAELERQRNKEQLETLFEVLPIGVVVADADGSLIRANDTAKEIWGGDVFNAESVAEYDKYPAVWADTGEPIAPDDWTMSQVLQGTEVTEPNIYEISAFDGEQRIIMEHGMPVRDECGDVSHAVITLTDITERREYQRKLEESNERLEQFAYAASHDLQEPLRMITSYLQLLEKRYDDAFDEDGEEFLEYAVNGAERMREMIDALLEYSRIETQGDPFEPVDLNETLEDVLADLQVQIVESGAEVMVEDLPHLEGDASQLRQLFQNLLDNAITYSGDEPPLIHVDADRRGDKWVISVEDNGIGIEPDKQERVFTVFDRLHSREEYDGTGIGLALCQRIVKRHGGEIWVESEPGEGATFSFTLPAGSEHDL
ncbi:PAS domain S-box protein [Haloterrigena salinisoli]|uniref:PAS domain S-box protein n=1 Tax=Haloterrigena salinisoli TaxID=3132747 RepID=UPI0030D1CFFF